MEGLGVRIKDSDSALDLAYCRYARAGVPVSITTTSININTSYSVGSADIWVYLRSAWSWCICFVRSSKLGRTYLSMLLHTVARSSSREATSPNSIRTFNNNQTTITLNPPIIMFEISKQKVLSCAVDTAMMYGLLSNSTKVWSACLHVLVLILVSFSYSHCTVPSRTGSSSSRQAPAQDENDVRIPITVPSRPHCLASSYFLSSLSLVFFRPRTTLTDRKPPTTR